MLLSCWVANLHKRDESAVYVLCFNQSRISTVVGLRGSSFVDEANQMQGGQYHARLCGSVRPHVIR